MNRTAVSSSTISSVGYDPDTFVLEIEFLNGSVYQYFDVPSAEYDQLVSAPSVGSYFSSAIKPTYRCARA
jgi:hypothetical protein